MKNARTTRYLLRLGLFAGALTLVASAPAGAQPMELGTPDGQPPSMETVCDGQSGAAFGLCNAYCEAMDCDSPDPQASPQAFLPTKVSTVSTRQARLRRSPRRD